MLFVNNLFFFKINFFKTIIIKKSGILTECQTGSISGQTFFRSLSGSNLLAKIIRRKRRHGRVKRICGIMCQIYRAFKKNLPTPESKQCTLKSGEFLGEHFLPRPA